MELLLKTYTDKLKDVMDYSSSKALGKFGTSNSIRQLNGLELKSLDNSYQTDKFLESPDSALISLGKQLGITPSKDHKIGKHPDFLSLIQNRTTENYEIVSVFIDLKGSKNILSKYGNSTGYYITNIIQTAAIHITTVFGGYIQRLEGDGLFVYFGGKNTSRTDNIKNSLIANSIFTYFVKNDLKELFEEDGIERINTRIGIDFGYSDDILWAVNGTKKHYELTTTGLHTSLAKTMQGYGYSNSIIVGDNIRNNLESFDMLFTTLKDNDGKVDESKRYVYKNPNYSQFDFNWFEFLKTLNLIKRIENKDYLQVNQIDSKTQNELDNLRKDTSLIGNNLAFTSSAGIINPNAGIKNQEHSFYFK